jgi:methylmalonyl-CoA mutase
VLAVDPTRRKGGGALLGDRIRMNAIDGVGSSSAPSRPARPAHEVPDHLDDVIAAAKARASTW